MDQERKQFLKNVTDFHIKLEDFVLENYGIKVKFSTTIAWGYKTTAVYLEDHNKNMFTAKLTEEGCKELDQLVQDINLSNYLNSQIPSPQYLKSKDGDYITKYAGYHVRLQNYIKGMPPFKMNLAIYKQAIEILKTIHNKEPPPFKLKMFDKSVRNTQRHKLLHGDLTPSNILISYDKISGVLDFEESMTGPVEYDLSRALVFSWFRMKNESFEQLLNETIKTYENDEKIDRELITKFSKLHLKERIENIQKHKGEYKDKKDWKDDLEHTTKRLEEVKKY